MKKVYAIVLNWNGLDDTVDCVRSMASLDIPEGVELTVVVVDNGSEQFQVAPLERVLPSVKIVRNAVNLGYCGGNNVGIRLALSEAADWVWVLNNDTLIGAGALRPLLETGDRNPRVGAVGGKVLRTDRPDTLWMAWGRVTWLQSLIALVGKDRPDGAAWDVERKVDWIPGCSILMRARALEEIGGFDENFFAYHEDVDWAARAQNAGWELWYNGASVIRHAVNASSGGEEASYTGFRSYLSARNSVLYARRHGSTPQKLRLAAAIVASLPFQWARRALRGQSAGVRMKIRGWRDALRGSPIPLKALGLQPDKPDPAS